MFIFNSIGHFLKLKVLNHNMKDFIISHTENKTLSFDYLKVKRFRRISATEKSRRVSRNFIF